MIKIWSDLAWNRLVYKEEDNKLYIVQCGTHYQQ